MTAEIARATAVTAQEGYLWRVTLQDKTSRPGLFSKPEERSPQDIYPKTTVWNPGIYEIHFFQFSDFTPAYVTNVVDSNSYGTRNDDGSKVESRRDCVNTLEALIPFRTPNSSSHTEFNGIKIRNFSDSANHNNEIRRWSDTINFSVTTPIDLSEEETHVNANWSNTSDVKGLALDLYMDGKLVDTVNEVGGRIRGMTVIYGGNSHSGRSADGNKVQALLRSLSH
ncbi:hypothetical protein V865_003382 [Kwoniella europaea PYCC6329]|uniref:Uncharacterized protein n=1 Tax=Kwoniella europaea PYCC6329 TaxID=1423913 RepID=A0AAX4KH23_9TREE